MHEASQVTDVLLYRCCSGMPLNTGSTRVSAQPQSTTSAEWLAVAYSAVTTAGTSVTAAAWASIGTAASVAARASPVQRPPHLQVREEHVQQRLPERARAQQVLAHDDPPPRRVHQHAPASERQRRRRRGDERASARLTRSTARAAWGTAPRATRRATAASAAAQPPAMSDRIGRQSGDDAVLGPPRRLRGRGDRQHTRSTSQRSMQRGARSSETPART